MERLLPSSPSGRQQHQLRIQNFLPGLLVAAVGTAHSSWCHFDNPLLADIVADQLGLQWNLAGCPIYAQNQCSAHLIFGPGNSS